MTDNHTPASPLLDEHRELGATFTDFAGWAMPLKYGSELSEHRAVRETAGLFDLSHMGEISVTGPQSAEALDFALVGEASKIALGRAKYSLMCDADGGVIDDLVVYRLADDRFLVVANAANAPTVARELAGRAEQFDAQVDDEATSTALIAVQGPASEAIVSSLVPENQREAVAALKYYAVTEALVDGIDVLLARTGYTGEDGFELYVPNAHAAQLWRSLLTATTAAGGAPAGLACRDTLRLEAGMALYGHELSRELNPYQAGLGKVVRLGKEFVGREALQGLSEQPVPRVLVGLKGSTRRAARAGYTVHQSADGGEVGTVTSGALSPTLGYPIALAYLDVALAEPGTVVQVDIRGHREQFEVTPAPFYRRN
ncbi:MULTISPECIES: glycine cleavage system aminomethyltransferase GcvT [unclassified Mycolicibacterium]|uniref:glycine cleavage system aminomethyltransferase GcvT n=1 Tax=unclassified Mycolicibacterium TaxID=2636767 RepID=UPI0012DE364F|nr:MULTISPECIES: glycine cleavage system aminomethyltransferase GcvT [unclassified Mycolicibacterium]MUL82035.1 glycine cleavage system aminomethyltransferase GcvT [Mycolicibacterium sp. CBMA 329]MUL87801.1 glycine cleavage system aminomethyltransferase GcvT [Mycolicibacterium sp. CBMA 331]MUM01625.1 glycine cleavage system aminomethyltransferase GcvT [Mycolicibacterium sp. CBMA 334]MUM25542.1 glycine cleavage system aminomethyltransferase GcvT [Mycolicibacterium sp. CBMA 295]MUM38098.1 glycin